MDGRKGRQKSIWSTYNLLANTPGQTISIFVIGGSLADSDGADGVNGVNFEIQTGDGGTKLGGAVSMPAQDH